MSARALPALLPVALAAAVIGLGACSSTGDEETTNEATEARTSEQPAETPQPLGPAEEHGRTLFAETCGACHTLDAAGTQGSIGPNLDEIQVDEAEVLKAIRIGGTGSGRMPAGLYEGEDARDVAKFVANSESG